MRPVPQEAHPSRQGHRVWRHCGGVGPRVNFSCGGKASGTGYAGERLS